MYTQVESSLLRAKLLSDWESLEFMRDFWNPEYDERDILQYRRLAPVWRMHGSGASYKQIATEPGEDTGKACALVSEKNCRSSSAESERLSRAFVRRHQNYFVRDLLSRFAFCRDS